MVLTNTSKPLIAPYPSWIHIYWQKICAGEILVGRRIKQNMQRLLADFEDPDVHIDLADSDKRIRFIQNECKLYEAPFAGKPFRLELFQKAIIESIYAIKVWSDEAGRFVRKYHDVLLMFGRKNGKALSVDTDIPTPDGWKKMGDLQVGDRVFAADGTPAEIIVASPVHENHDCYQVTFSDGAKIVADGEHLWAVWIEGFGRFNCTTEQLARAPELVSLASVPRFLTDTPVGCSSRLFGSNEWVKITKIGAVPSVPVKCIGIEHHSHLYLAGRKFTATHNTPLASAISLSEFICGEMGTKVLFGSNDYDQADLAFQAADAMREESPKIERCTRRNNKGIFFGNPKHKVLKGKFSYQNKGCIRKISAHGKNKEGRNIKVGVVDEVHEMQDNSLVAPIRQALSTQEEPLYFEITTEGFTDDGYLDQRLAEAEKVLDGEIDRPDWVIWWFCQDSEEEVWQDESSWVKSNPGLGAIKKWSYLRKQVDEARTNSSTRAFVLSKDFNIKQNSAVAWLDVGDIENQAEIDMSLLRGQLALGGVDLAETTDLCSARLFIETPEPLNGYRRFTFGMYFIPEVKADAVLEDNNLNPERKNYREWEKQGLVTICPGTEVDDDTVVEWFVGIYREWGIIPYKVGFDNWHSKAFKSRFAELFGEDVLERVGMDFMSLSGAMRALEADLKRKALNYNNNEVDRWCLKNTAVKTNNIGLIMPVKKYGTSKNRIDGALSGIITYAVLNRFRSEYRSAQMMR